MSAAQHRAAWPQKVDGRTLQQVRRGSVPEEASDPWFIPTPKAAATRIMRGAERLAKQAMKTRKKGARWGRLTPIDLQVLEALLFRFMTWRTGKLDPSYEQLREATGRARETIARALDRLEAAGFLKKLRRFVKTEVEGKGPQVQQTTNAYRVMLPAAAAALLGSAGAPPPEDAEIHQAELRLASAEMAAQDTGRASLESELARLGRGVTQRDFRT